MKVADGGKSVTAKCKHDDEIFMRKKINSLSEQLGMELLHRKWRVATAESCTGGGIAAAITATAGSSSWFEYGIVSYANAAKQKLLGVSAATLEAEGAVSEAVVTQMMRGVLKLSNADIAVAISGIAGPGGGSPEKPVGMVWFAWGTAAGQTNTARVEFAGDRNAVQKQSVTYALDGLIQLLKTDDF